MNIYSSTFQHIHFALTLYLFGDTNSNVFSGFITARSLHSHRGGSSSRLNAARCFSLAVIGGGLGGVEPNAGSAHVDVSLYTNHRKGGTQGQTSLHRRSTERKKYLSWSYTTRLQQNISSPLTQTKKKRQWKQLLTLKRLYVQKQRVAVSGCLD